MALTHVDLGGQVFQSDFRSIVCLHIIQYRLESMNFIVIFGYGFFRGNMLVVGIYQGEDLIKMSFSDKFMGIVFLRVLFDD